MLMVRLSNGILMTFSASRLYEMRTTRYEPRALSLIRTCSPVVGMIMKQVCIIIAPATTLRKSAGSYRQILLATMIQ